MSGTSSDSEESSVSGEPQNDALFTLRSDPKNALDDSSEESSSEEEELGFLERRAVKAALREKEEREAFLADHAETEHARTTVLEDAEAGSASGVVDLSEIRTRMQETARVLSNFATEREEGRSRHEYLSLLVNDIATYHDYSPWLVEKYMSLFPVAEAMEFFEVNDAPRPFTIRVNTLKVRRKDVAQTLINRGVNLDPIKWCKEGLQIFESQVPVGATPEYLSGYYMLQSAASFLPVLALAPREKERILDMCAAPGGKTSHIGALMRNTGILFANDKTKARTKALVGNLHRMGLTNTIVTNYDGLEFPKVMGNFDRVLLDAPCTGLGVISRDLSAKTSKTEEDIQRCSELQKRLILAAIDSVSAKSETGGVIVYSTCSITVEENEEVVNYALKHRHVKLLDTKLGFGRPGYVNFRRKRFDASMRLAVRVYPHTHNLDGFFVAKLQKIADGPKKKKASAPDAVPSGLAEVVADAPPAASTGAVASAPSTDKPSSRKRESGKAKGKRKRGKRTDSDREEPQEGGEEATSVKRAHPVSKAKRGKTKKNVQKGGKGKGNGKKRAKPSAVEDSKPAETKAPAPVNSNFFKEFAL